jgi:hypothetical protein
MIIYLHQSRGKNNFCVIKFRTYLNSGFKNQKQLAMQIISPLIQGFKGQGILLLHYLIQHR